MKKHSGVASFYIVTISALLLTITAVGFVSLVISETQRTLNSDLSKSAYDSALAGVEDAKVAILNYQSCVNQGFYETSITYDGVVTCGEIIYYMHHPDCDMVGHILGRISENDPVTNPNAGQEVIIQEEYSANTKNNLQQAYTCVKITSNLNDYRASLTSEVPTHIIPITIPNPEDVKAIRISWYSDTNGTEFKYNNITNNGSVVFPQLTYSQLSTPPMISAELIQTAISFRLSDLDVSRMYTATQGQTDHGTLYFVPTNKKSQSGHTYKVENGSVTSNVYDAIYYDISSDNEVKNTDKMNFATSNDKTSKKVPLTVYCPENSGSEFACSVSVELPDIIPGSDGNTVRGADTFMLILAVPYGQPDTDFSVELCSKTNCEDAINIAAGLTDTDAVSFGDSQFRIDSTGRANDLYRRVETRIENFDSYFPISSYVIQAMNSDKNDSAINKNLVTGTEWNF